MHTEPESGSLLWFRSGPILDRIGPSTPKAAAGNSGQACEYWTIN